MASDDSGDYEVGRGKPPRHTRFKKGQSGNPKGRPRGSGNVYTLAHRELKKKVVIVVDGERKKITKLQAVMIQLVNGAATGKLRNIQLLLQMFPSMEKAQKMALRDEPPKLTEMPREQFSREILSILIESGEIRMSDLESPPVSTANAPAQPSAPALPDQTKP
jgi:hypothetical protein